MPRCARIITGAVVTRRSSMIRGFVSATYARSFREKPIVSRSTRVCTATSITPLSQVHEPTVDSRLKFRERVPRPVSVNIARPHGHSPVSLYLIMLASREPSYSDPHRSVHHRSGVVHRSPAAVPMMSGRVHTQSDRSRRGRSPLKKGHQVRDNSPVGSHR